MHELERARILVVDDDEPSREGLVEVLRGAGHDVCSAADGRRALAVLQDFQPDLVISDVSMPHLGGYGLVQCIREGSLMPDVPIILVSSHADTKNRVHGFDFGADDFLSKPLDVDELLAHVARHLSRARRQRETARLSVSDELTGMLNRRGIANFFARAQAESGAHGRGVGMVMVDLTKFKAINDCYGHAVGDLALCATARTLQDAIRASDRVARIGGDEFLVVLPNVDANVLAQLSARLQERLPIRVRLTDHDEIVIGFALGSACGDAGDSFEALSARADSAMYAHKRALAADSASGAPQAR